MKECVSYSEGVAQQACGKYNRGYKPRLQSVHEAVRGLDKRREGRLTENLNVTT
jgi:hypothetical protein